MANTRQSAKRARQADKRQERNNLVRSKTKTLVKKVVVAASKDDADAARTAFAEATQGLAKAASKGAIPKRRAARKISRLHALLKKKVPAALERAPAAK